MTTDAAATTPEEARPGPRWLSLTVAIVFGLFFAFDLFEALTNLFGVLEEYNRFNTAREALDLPPFVPPWAVLLANVAAPVFAFGVAWWLGRGRRAGAQAVIYLVALAVVAAFTLTLIAVARGLL